MYSPMFCLSGLLALAIIAGGLALLHRARREAPAPLLHVAAWLLLAGGIAMGLCALYQASQCRSQCPRPGMHGGCARTGHGAAMHPGLPGTDMGSGMNSQEEGQCHKSAPEQASGEGK